MKNNLNQCYLLMKYGVKIIKFHRTFCYFNLSKGDTHVHFCLIEEMTVSNTVSQFNEMCIR